MLSPLLLLVFNRPDSTRQVFDAIRQAQPQKLYIAADGPRSQNISDIEKCAHVKEIFNQIDWPCQVRTLYRSENLGCKKAVSSAIDWFFEHEEEGIILEDDCLPSISFFQYCDEMLEKYRTDKRIFIISGHNRQNTWKTENADYFFSNFGGIWGWATWKRAWLHFDSEMNFLEDFSSQDMFEYLLGKQSGTLRQSILMDVKKRKIDSWAYPWGFSRHINSGLACVPSKNLIQNIGFGTEATHTFGKSLLVPLNEITFPLKENKFVVADRKYDELFQEKMTLIRKLISLFKRF